MDALTPTADLLEARYREIAETRMQGIPILNGALAVKALGMRVWGDHMLCVLLTPWFMNVVLLAREDETENRPAGSKQTFAFPAGSFEFILGREEGIGPHWMCSLFSPVLEFADQETAEAAALAAIDELFSDARLSPDTARAVASLVGAAGVIDLMATVCFYSTLGYLLNTAETPLDEDIAAELADNPLP